MVDVPKDVQLESIEIDRWPKPGRPDPIPCGKARVLGEAARMIAESLQPILYLGAASSIPERLRQPDAFPGMQISP